MNMQNSKKRRAGRSAREALFVDGGAKKARRTRLREMDEDEDDLDFPDVAADPMVIDELAEEDDEQQA